MRDPASIRGFTVPQRPYSCNGVTIVCEILTLFSDFSISIFDIELDIGTL